MSLPKCDDRQCPAFRQCVRSKSAQDEPGQEYENFNRGPGVRSCRFYAPKPGANNAKGGEHAR